jgi:hypothetical protein
MVHVMHDAYWLLPTAGILFIWGWRNFGRRSPGWWPGIVKGGLWGLLPLAVLVGPFYALFFAQLGRSGDDLEAGGLIGHAPDLLAYLIPAPTNPVLAKLGLIPALSFQLFPRPDSLDGGVAYLGLAGLGLAVLGLAKRWRSQTQPWMWLALLSGVLALGPFLKIGGQLVEYNLGDVSSYVPMPYALVAKMPFLSWGRTTDRLNQTMMLGMSVLSAFGAMTLLSQWREKLLAKGLVIGLTFIFILESLVVFPLPQANPAVSPYYRQLQAAETTPAGGWLDLPLESSREVNSAMFFQTYHRRPIVGGFIHRKFEHVKRSQRFAILLFTPPMETDVFDPPGREERLAALRSLGITTVVAHKDLVSKAADQAQVDFATALLGRPLYEDDLIRVHAVPPGETLQTPVVLPDPGDWQVDRSAGGLYPLAEAKWHVYGYAPRSGWIKWRLDVTPLVAPTVLTVNSDVAPAQRLLVPASQRFELPPIPLPAGFSRFNWANPEACPESRVCAALRFEGVAPEQAEAVDSPLAVWGENRLQLVTYAASLDSETDQLSLVFYWLPLEPLEPEPTIFTHLLDAAGNRLAQADHRLLDGQYPPQFWLPGVLVRDVVTLPLAADDNWPLFSIRVGLYDVATGARFEMSAPQTADNSLVLPLEGALER